MRKTVALSLSIILILCLSGCFSRIKEGEIGKTYVSADNIEFTLNAVSFAEAIDGRGGANEDFWKPLTKREEYYSARGIIVTNDENDRIVFISYTAKNISKEDVVIDDIGTLNYDDGYKYDKGSLAFRLSKTAVWQENNSGLNVEKLSEKEYEFRAYMVVPKQVVESDKSLTYTLFNYEFKIK